MSNRIHSNVVAGEGEESDYEEEVQIEEIEVYEDVEYYEDEDEDMIEEVEEVEEVVAEAGKEQKSSLEEIATVPSSTTTPTTTTIPTETKQPPAVVAEEPKKVHQFELTAKKEKQMQIARHAFQLSLLAQADAVDKNVLNLEQNLKETLQSTQEALGYIRTSKVRVTKLKKTMDLMETDPKLAWLSSVKSVVK